MAKKNRSAGLSREEMVANEVRRLRGEIGIELAKRSAASGMNVSLGDIDEEYNPELKTIRGRTSQYERMINDPFVRGQLRNIEMTLVSGVRWNMVDGTQEQQDLVGGNILRQGPPKYWCQQSWYDFLHEGLGMLIYGWSMFGLTRGIVDNKMVYTNRKWLHPRSVDEDGWVMDEDDNLIAVRRSFTDATGRAFARQATSAQDLFMMCWDRRGPNWEGTALIRPMFKNWKIGEIAEKIDIIDLQNRGIAIPVAKLSGAGGPKERDTLVEILRTLRGGNKDKAFLVLEKDESLEFLTTQGTAKDASRIIDSQHIGISKVGGGEYAEISGMAGGRASTSVLATGFFINTDAIRIFFEDKINFGEGQMPGVCESLQNGNFDINAPGFKYSRVSGSRVSPTEQFDNIPLIQDSVKAGLVPTTLKLCNETLRRLGWPEMTEQEYNEGMLRAGKGPQPMGRPSEAGPDANPSRGDAQSNAAPEPSRTPPAEPSPAPKNATEVPSDAAEPVARRSLQQSGFGRQPTDEESHVLALAQIDAENRSAEQKYVARIHAWQRREIDQIVAGIRSGRIKPGTLMKDNAEAGLLKFTGQLANELKNILTQVKNFGGAQVRDEMKRQESEEE